PATGVSTSPARNARRRDRSGLARLATFRSRDCSWWSTVTAERGRVEKVAHASCVQVPRHPCRETQRILGQIKAQRTHRQGCLRYAMARTAAMKSRILAWSFFPGDDSTPLETSTA